MGLFGKLFGRKGADEKAPQEQAAEAEGAAHTGGGAAFGGEAAQEEYEEFCATVQLRPGVLLMDHLAAHGPEKLRQWLHPNTPEPEPKGFIQAALGLARKGSTLADLSEDPIDLWTDGWPQYDGGPSERTGEALKLLAGLINRTFKLYYQRKSDEQYVVLQFNP